MFKQAQRLITEKTIAKMAKNEIFRRFRSLKMSNTLIQQQPGSLSIVDEYLKNIRELKRDRERRTKFCIGK
uniref:Uncharacterized protein n=1 Tax=Romanomermis culicivorax TaxID=13658 RepID=A0A915JBF0_ROMCU